MKLTVGKQLVLIASVFILGATCSTAFAQKSTNIFPAVAEETNTCGKKMTAEMKAQRALDILEIQNVAGMHEYYHSALMHKEEYENIFSKRDDVMWTNNSDKYVGKDFVKFYVDGCPLGDKKKGSLWYHMLATPVIVVAADGQTAKAVYQSFGNVTGTGMLQWTEEKYGMDFIKEDGKWKIWHLRTYVEFYTDATTTNTKLWAGQNLAAPTGASNAASVPAGTPGAGPNKEEKKDATGVTIKEEPGVKFADDLKPTENGNYYEGYSENYMPTFNPVPPEAYCTWTDTWAY
jgi:hypothetical protein